MESLEIIRVVNGFVIKQGDKMIKQDDKMIIMKDLDEVHKFIGDIRCAKTILLPRNKMNMKNFISMKG